MFGFRFCDLQLELAGNRVGRFMVRFNSMNSSNMQRSFGGRIIGLAGIFLLIFCSCFPFHHRRPPERSREPVIKSAVELKLSPDNEILGVMLKIPGRQFHAYEFRLYSTSDGEYIKTIDLDEGIIQPFSFSYDGKYIAIADTNNDVHIRDMQTNDVIQTLQGHLRMEWYYAVSPDGNYRVAKGKEHRGLKMLNSIDHSTIITIMPKRYKDMHFISFSPDSSLFVIENDNTIEVRTSATGEMLSVFNSENDLKYSIISPDNKIIAISDSKKQVCLYSLDTGEKLATIENAINVMLFSPNSRYFANGNIKKTIDIYSLYESGVVHSVKSEISRYSSVCFTPDGKYLLAGGADGKIIMWSTDDGKHVRTFEADLELPNDKWEGYTFKVTSIAINDAGSILACGGHSMVNFIEMETGKVMQKIEHRRGSSDCIYFLPDNQRVMLHAGGATMFYSLETGAVVDYIPSFHDNLYNIEFSPNDKLIATSGPDSTVRLWSVKTGEQLNQIRIVFQDNEYGERYRLMAFSPDSKFLAVNVYEKIEIYSCDPWKLVRTITLENDQIPLAGNLVFSSDGSKLAAVTKYGQAHITSLSTDETITEIIEQPGVVSSMMQFNEDFFVCVVGDKDFSTRFWSVNTGEFIREITGLNTKIYDAILSSDYKTFITGGGDNKVVFRSVETGEIIREIEFEDIEEN